MQKQPWEWTEEDIISMVENGVEENLNLDYKACGSLSKEEKKKSEISKDISAFANSAGGTVIYGIIEEGNKPLKIDEGFDPKVISKEWLEQIIDSKIQRKVPGVRINPIELSSSKGERVIYVVYIPQSPLAPHMASDNRYYKRYNFQSKPMEDYEVKDVANRYTAPDLYVDMNLDTHYTSFKNASYDNDDDEEESYSDLIDLRFWIGNRSITPVEYATVIIIFDEKLRVAFNRSYDQVESHNRGNCTVFSHNWGIPSKMPIWKDRRYLLSSDPIQVQVPFSYESVQYEITIQVMAPYMETKEYEYHIFTPLHFGNPGIGIGIKLDRPQNKLTDF